MLRPLVAVARALFAFVDASAQDWRGQFSTLVGTPRGSERDSLIARIVSAWPDWHEVMTEIESLTFSDTTKGRTRASLCIVRCVQMA
jgi:hypothetical protein